MTDQVLWLSAQHMQHSGVTPPSQQCLHRNPYIRLHQQLGAQATGTSTAPSQTHSYLAAAEPTHMGTVQWQSSSTPQIGSGSSLQGEVPHQMRSSIAAAAADAIKSRAGLQRSVHQTGPINHNMNNCGLGCGTQPCLVQVPGGQASAASRHGVRTANSKSEAECAVPPLPQSMCKAQVVGPTGAVSLY